MIDVASVTQEEEEIDGPTSKSIIYHRLNFLGEEKGDENDTLLKQTAAL